MLAVVKRMMAEERSAKIQALLREAEAEVDGREAAGSSNEVEAAHSAS